MKICSICGIEKMETDFYYTYDYPRKYCKKCEHSKRVSVGVDKKKFVVELLGGKCNRCGLVDEYYMYDIHHKNRKDKTFEPSNFIARRSKLLWIDEISTKCELLCANCHRRTTQEEMYS